MIASFILDRNMIGWIRLKQVQRYKIGKAFHYFYGHDDCDIDLTTLLNDPFYIIAGIF